MPTQAFAADVQATLLGYSTAAKRAGTISVQLETGTVQVPYPYLSPTD